MKTKMVVCSDCRGAGVREGEQQPCPLCNGRGERLEVHSREDLLGALKAVCLDIVTDAWKGNLLK